MTKQLKINVARHEVFVGKTRVHLMPKEFEILLMLKTSGNVLSRKEIMDHVWKEPMNVETRTVDQHIARMRKKLKVDLIETVPQYGYRIA